MRVFLTAIVNDFALRPDRCHGHFNCDYRLPGHSREKPIDYSLFTDRSEAFSFMEVYLPKHSIYSRERQVMCGAVEQSLAEQIQTQCHQ